MFVFLYISVCFVFKVLTRSVQLLLVKDLGMVKGKGIEEVIISFLNHLKKAAILEQFKRFRPLMNSTEIFHSNTFTENFVKIDLSVSLLSRSHTLTKNLF